MADAVATDVNPPPSGRGTPQLRTLLFTDICDSTEIVHLLGDGPAADLFQAHDALVLELQQHWRARLIDRSDGLLLLFERAIDGLGFALDYMRGLHRLGATRRIALRARAGLNVGEVLTWHNSDEAVQLGAKPLEVEGLAKPMAARLMQLARPGQILMSAVAEPLAHRAASELGARGEQLLWKSYGRWVFKGVPVPQEVFEVGEPSFAPLRPPNNTPKAWRDVPFWRRPASLAAEAMLLAVIGVGSWFATKSTPAIAFSERDWVVVGDLRNLTGDARLDDALEQAFRISLEQSRYVNVVSDLKVRETASRMQRPEGATVDRGTGAEIAQRVGARALVLPTVSEVGGRLRVSAEVVDPRSQVTVYAVTAEGRGESSALKSVDTVGAGLRSQLGEALAAVQKNSLPLPDAATSNLDALKAFAQARTVAETTRDRDTVLSLYSRALQLDPQFALAHADLARFFAGLGEVANASDEWRKALASPHRLSAQETLRVQLMLQQNDAPASYFRAAKQYLALYPDDDQVIARLGTNAWHQLNAFPVAEALFRWSLSPAFARQGARTYSLAITELGQDRIAQAIQGFREATALGFTGSGEFAARPFDALDRPADSDRTFLASSPGHGGWKGEAGVSTYLSRGQWPQAKSTAETWWQQVGGSKDVVGMLRAQAALATVAAVSANAADAALQRNALARRTRDNQRAVDAVYPPASTELRLYGGLLAALRNDPVDVAAAVRATSGSMVVREYPTIAQLRQVVLAEQDRLAGRPRDALARLAPLVSQDSALVCVHWAVQRAAQAAGDDATAAAQSRWMATHRGRLFAESTTTDVLRFFNASLAQEALH